MGGEDDGFHQRYRPPGGQDRGGLFEHAASMDLGHGVPFFVDLVCGLSGSPLRTPSMPVPLKAWATRYNTTYRFPSLAARTMRNPLTDYAVMRRVPGTWEPGVFQATRSLNAVINASTSPAFSVPEGGRAQAVSSSAACRDTQA